MNFLILCVLLLAPLWGEDKKPVDVPAKKEVVAPPKKDPRNVRQYDFETYCKMNWYYFDHPQGMIRYYPEIFKGVAPDIAAGFVQQKMLHNLAVAGCEW